MHKNRIGRELMINDVFEESRKRILQTFPERQIYLRSGGEVSYYVFGTNPFRAPAKEVKRVKAQYERLLEDARAKEANARLRLTEQRENFEQVAKNLEEKHATLSQIFKSGEDDPKPITGAEYAKSHVLMSPRIRDTIPRQDRLNISDTQDTILSAAETQILDSIENNRAIISATELNVETVLQSGPFGKGGLFIASYQC